MNLIICNNFLEDDLHFLICSIEEVKLVTDSMVFNIFLPMNKVSDK